MNCGEGVDMLGFCGKIELDRVSMKVCLINNLFFPYNKGGAEQVVKTLADGFVSKGDEVVVLTSTPISLTRRGDGGEVVYGLPPRNLYFYSDGCKHRLLTRVLWHFFDIFNMATALKVRKILLEEKPAVVYTHNLMGLSFLIPFVLRRLKLRHIHTVHDVQLVEPSGIIWVGREKSWRYHNPLTWLYVWLMKKLMGSPETVVSSSRFLIDFYKARGFFPRSQFKLERNPVSVEKVARPERDSITEFLYLGQIEKHKGVLFLARAFVDLMKKENNLPCELKIVGKGSLEKELRDIIGSCSQARFLGPAQREEIPALLSRADVLVAPTLVCENTPTVVNEALACGLQVIVSDAPGASEMVEDGKTGYIFKCGDASDLQKKMRMLC